jgi:hypothetical protein
MLDSDKHDGANLIAGDCCFLSSCIDLDESDLRSSLMHLLGMGNEQREEDGDVEILVENNQSETRDSASVGRNSLLPYPRRIKYSRSTSGGKVKAIKSSLVSKSKSKSKPPPVIALSRSSCSTNSESSASSSLAAPDFEPFHHCVTPTHEDNRRRLRISQQEENGSISVLSHERNYAAQHELLINSLFDDAKRRQELQETALDQTDEHLHYPIDTSLPLSGFHTPAKNHNGSTPVSTLTSDKSVASKLSKYSRNSNNSNNSGSSQLLTSSSHRFKKTLKSHRGINLVGRFRRKRQRRQLRTQHRTHFAKFARSASYSTPSSTSQSSLPNLQLVSPHLSDSSACSGGSMTASSRGGPSLQFFLDENVKLQKDSGKGQEVGSKISGNGRDETLQKLNDKMDVLAEVDRDGKWANATVNRIPAKDMTQEKKEHGIIQHGFVETRSMLAIKLGFVSLKYGVLVHWNIQTGLAELILLRKSCSGSFMKVSLSSSQKGKGGVYKRSNHTSDKDRNDISFLATPSFVTCDSLQTDNSFDSLDIYPVASAHF